MSNYHVELIDKPAALTKEAIKSLRKQQVQGLSRRQLMRAALGTGIGLWLFEVTAGTLGLRLAESRRRLRCPDQDRRPRHGQARRTRRSRSTRGSRPTTRKPVRS